MLTRGLVLSNSQGEGEGRKVKNEYKLKILSCMEKWVARRRENARRRYGNPRATKCGLAKSSATLP
jgi:3-oxoacyl-[acyl-carrier-protein] synthase III